MVTSRKAGADAMMVVHHACDAVKTETVKVILLHPEAEVAHEETEDLVVPVIEEAAIPELVSSAGTFMEVEMVSAVEVVEAIENVFASVRMDDVEEDGDTHAVRGVYELL